jgi:hypothetical protein
LLALFLLAATAGAQAPGVSLSGAGEASDGALTVRATVGQTGAGVVGSDNLQLLGGFAYRSIEPAVIEPAVIDTSQIRLVVVTRLLVGAVAPGDTTVQQLTIRNDGFAPVSLEIASDATSFLPVPAALTVEAKQTGVIDILFAPLEVGEARGTLVFTGPAGQELLGVQVAGYGGVPPAGPVSIDFALGPGNQDVRQVGGAVVGSVFTAELHATAASAFDGWNVVLDLPPSLRYVAGSFQPSALIPGLLALADLQGRSLSIGGTTFSAEDVSSSKGLLGTFEMEVTDAFVDSVQVTVVEVTLSLVGIGWTPQLVSSTAVITARPSETLPGDFNDDGVVDLDDFSVFADGFGTRDPRFDLDGSGLVDFADLFEFADLFGTRR